MKEMGGLKTTFEDAVVPTNKSLGGDWGGTKNGSDAVRGGEKGAAGKIPEVTLVDVNGAPGANDSVGVGKEVANRKGSTLKD